MIESIVRFRVQRSSGYNDLFGHNIVKNIEKEVVKYFKKNGINFQPYPEPKLGLGAGGELAGLLLKLVIFLRRLFTKILDNSARKAGGQFRPSINIDLGLLAEGYESYYTSIYDHPGFSQAKLIGLGRNLIEALKVASPTTNFSLTTRIRHVTYQYNCVCHINSPGGKMINYDYAIRFIKELKYKNKVYERVSIGDSFLISHEKFFLNIDGRVSSYKKYQYVKIDKIINGLNRTNGIKVTNVGKGPYLKNIERLNRPIEKFVGLNGLFDLHAPFKEDKKLPFQG